MKILKFLFGSLLFNAAGKGVRKAKKRARRRARRARRNLISLLFTFFIGGGLLSFALGKGRSVLEKLPLKGRD